MTNAQGPMTQEVPRSIFRAPHLSSLISHLSSSRSLLHRGRSRQASRLIPKREAVAAKAARAGDLPIDYLSITGHKIGAPKGIGALYVNKKAPFVPFVQGGHQESSRRGGTENVASIVGLGTAAGIAQNKLSKYDSMVRPLRDALEEGILSTIPNAERNGHATQRLANTANIYLPGIDSDAALTFLDSQDVCASSGSACMESAITPSHVIKAMSGSHERSSESIRFSLSTHNSNSEIGLTLQKMKELIEAVS